VFSRFETVRKTAHGKIEAMRLMLSALVKWLPRKL